MENNNFVPNGLLLSSEETFVARVLEGKRWSQVEDRTTELLQCVQLNHKSEALRNNIISYLRGLITSHVPCQVPKLCFICNLFMTSFFGFGFPAVLFSCNFTL